MLEEALQNRDAAFDYYYLDAVKRGDSAEAGIALEAVVDALGQGAAVVPACGRPGPSDGHVWTTGRRPRGDPTTTATPRTRRRPPDEDEDPFIDGCLTTRTSARWRRQPAWAEDHRIGRR